MQRRRPAVGFWATVAGFVILAYVLSFGPAVWMLDRGVLPASRSSVIGYIYYPMVRGLNDGPRPIRKAISWYAALGARPRDERIYDIDGVD